MVMVMLTMAMPHMGIITTITTMMVGVVPERRNRQTPEAGLRPREGMQRWRLKRRESDRGTLNVFLLLYFIGGFDVSMCTVFGLYLVKMMHLRI